MLAGAYSNQFRLLQEQHIHKLKILSAAAGDAALENDTRHGNKTGKSRQLSLETNKRRKVQEMRHKMVALKEEKRRQEILLQRRQLQQEATERFQRAPLQNRNRTKGTNLEDILCILRGGTALIPTKQQRSSSARVLSKDRDKNSNSPLHGVNKLLTNRPYSQPGRTFVNDHLHDQSLRNLTNSRNLFEQQLRQRLQQLEKTKQREQATVTPEEEDTDSEDNTDLYSVDSVEDTRQDQVVTEKDQFMRLAEENRQKQKQTRSSNCGQNFGLKTDPKRINGQSNLAARESTSYQEQLPIRQTNDIQQQQQIPSDQQKNPASGDGKNTRWASQTNKSSLFQKTAWIQPSLILNNGLDSSFHQPMPAWVNLSKAGTHFDICQTNPKEAMDEDQSNRQDRMLPKDRQPICGAPVRQIIFQPKHNFYERQLSTTFHPVTSGLSQQRQVWVTEREQQSKMFPNPLQTEQYPEQTRPQTNSYTATGSGAVPYLQSKNNLPIPENKLKCPQETEPIEILQPSGRNCDNLLKSAGKSENDNNAIVPGDVTDDQPIIEKQTQQNSQPLAKSRNAVINKNNAWQESGRKTLPRKLSAGNGKTVRSILKVPSAENGSGRELYIKSTQLSDIRDSLEITRQQFNSDSGEITAANTRSKSAKKHVHFAVPDQFFEVEDELTAARAEFRCAVLASNGAEETIKNPSSLDNNNSNNCSHTQQRNGNVQQKANNNDKESDNKDHFCNKPRQKPQVNWVQPSGRPQAKAHIIKRTPQVAEEGPKITDPTPPNGTWTDKKGNNEKPLSKNNNVQYISMGTLKKLVASNNPGLSNPKNSYLRKELETTMIKEQTPFAKSGFSVDKTPTDEEINWLWDKVQMCLQQKSTPKPVAPTVSRTKPMLSHMYLDGGILGKSNALCVGKTAPSFWYPPTCNGGFTLDGQTTANYARRLALLQRRPSPPAPRVPMTATSEKVPPFPSESGTPSGSESRFPATSSKEVTSSLAGFLKAEELSQMASVTESQAFVAMKEAEVGTLAPSGVPRKYRGSSILSLEEKRLMESLERINNKLKGCTSDYSQTALNGIPRHLFLTNQLQGMKVPLMRYHAAQPSPPNQATPKGWLKGPEL